MNKEELLTEIKCSLEDCFVARVEENAEESSVYLRFVGGKTFALRLEELDA